MTSLALRAPAQHYAQLRLHSPLQIFQHRGRKVPFLPSGSRKLRRMTTDSINHPCAAGPSWAAATSRTAPRFSQLRTGTCNDRPSTDLSVPGANRKHEKHKTQEV